MNRKKLLTLLFGLVLALGLATTALAAEKGDVVILYTNDVHCEVDQKASTNIGYAGVAAYKNQLEAQLGDENVLLVDAGDAIQGAAIGTLSKGEYLVSIMNFLGYDYATYGNHEFDYGMAQALKLQSLADYTYLSCNFTDLKAGATVAAPYAVFEAQGRKIALVGISTPETFTKSTPAYFQDEDGNYIYGFCEDRSGQVLCDAVQAAIDAARAEGAEIVIALGHLGIEETSAPWRSTDVIAGVSGLDAFIDGHSHSTIPGETVQDKDGKDVILTSTGTKLQNLGQLTITADGKITTELVSAAACTEQDPDALAFVDEINEQNKAMLETVVAVSDVPLTTKDPATGNRMVRSAETNLGDLCADAYRYVSGADIAFVNGGGVRADIPAGEITFNQVISVHPFGNELCMVEATGQEILDALEWGSRNAPGELGGFLHVSGLMYTIDTTIESTVTYDEKVSFTGVAGARRVKDVYVLQDGAYIPIDPEATYTLSSHNYMLRDCGDGFTMFTDNNFLLEDVMLDNQVLITYIQEGLGGVIGDEYADAYGEGRIYVRKAPFADVGDSSVYYFAPVEYMKEMGIMNGVGENLFAPEESLTRGMLAAMLYRCAAPDSAPAPGSASFLDVPAGSYYDDAIGWAVANDIVEGYPGDVFKPDQPITREELAAMLYRAFGGDDYDPALSPALEAEDWADVSDWAQDAMAWAVEAGIINGTGADSLVLSPGATATRAEAATMLYRLLALIPG